MPYIRNIIFKQFTKWCFTLEFGFTMLLKQCSKEKKQDDKFLRKRTEEKQISVTIMIFVDGKGIVFPVKLKLEGESFE